MKFCQYLLFALFFLTLPEFSQGQNLKENELVVIQGEKFILHQVRTGETVYSISKRYGITVEEIYTYNPAVQRLRKGMVLKIPQWDLSQKQGGVIAQGPLSAVRAQNQAEMLEHNVGSGETLYSISKKYQVAESDILHYNPEAKNLKAGSKLYIPKKPVENPLVEWVSESNVQVKYFNHTIVSGETLYGITQKYKVGEEELKAINPELRFAFRAGAVVRIPVSATKEAPEQVNAGIISGSDKNDDKAAVFGLNRNTPVNCIPENRVGSKGKTVMALFLPLFLEANEQLNKDLTLQENDSAVVVQPIDQLTTDTIIEHEKPARLLKKFHGNSENFLQFYEGVLIAADSMQKAGMNIILNVFDTKDDPATVRKIINSQSFSETDLIIGPVFENIQKEVTQISVRYQIPMISPFTPKSAILDSNPYFYQINPTRGYLAEATAELIANSYSNSNFIVVRTSSYPGTQENQFVELIRRKLSKQGSENDGKYTEYDFRKGRSPGLREILSPVKENVVFIPSSDEGELSVAISNINNLAVDFPITLIGAVNYQQRYPSIEIAHFHNLKMKYINPYWVDYNKPETIGYIDKFMDNFGTEPNSFGMQGFDAAWYFLNALHLYGKDFEDCLPYLNVNLVQGNYYFKRVSASGGYMNQGVSVISYNRNFEMERQSVIGQPKFEGAN